MVQSLLRASVSLDCSAGTECTHLEVEQSHWLSSLSSSQSCHAGWVGSWCSFGVAHYLSPRCVLSRVKLECSSQACSCSFFTSQAVTSVGLQTQVCCFIVFKYFLLHVVVTFSFWWLLNPARPQTVPPTFKMPSSFSCLCCRSLSSRERQSHQVWATSPETTSDRALRNRGEAAWDCDSRESDFAPGRPAARPRHSTECVRAQAGRRLTGVLASPRSWCARLLTLLFPAL